MSCPLQSKHRGCSTIASISFHTIDNISPSYRKLFSSSTKNSCLHTRKRSEHYHTEQTNSSSPHESSTSQHGEVKHGPLQRCSQVPCSEPPRAASWHRSESWDREMIAKAASMSTQHDKQTIKLHAMDAASADFVFAFQSPVHFRLTVPRRCGEVSQCWRAPSRQRTNKQTTHHMQRTKHLTQHITHRCVVFLRGDGQTWRVRSV